MNSPIKTSMTAILLWSVAVVPAATVSYMATADMAFAKSDKAGGNGRGNSGKSSNAGGKAKTTTSGKSGTKGNSGGGKSASRASGSDPVGKIIDRVLGRDKKSTRTKRTTTKRTTTVARSKAPKVRPNTDPMHPSNLGNMNGALNANVNAVLAHIKNGNANGPVGHLAALAVANVNADGAQEVVDLKQDFIDLQSALDGTDYETVAEYYEALDGVDPIIIDDIDMKVTALNDANASQDALDDALADSPYASAEEYLNAVGGGAETDADIANAIDNYMDPSDAQADLDMALSDSGYTELSDYEVDREGVPGIDEITEVSSAINTLGGDVEERVDVSVEEPSDDAVVDANEDLAAQDDAEVAILDYWNKNGDADPAISEEEQALLDKLNERLDADAAAIEAAVGTDEPVMDGDGDGEVVECEADDESCGPAVDDEVASIAE